MHLDDQRLYTAASPQLSCHSLTTCAPLLPAAPAGSGLEGAICHRCYMAYRTKGSLPTKPNARLRRVLAGLQQRQGGETGSS